MQSVKKYSGLFSFAGKEIPYFYWSNLQSKTPPDTVIFLGAGAVGIIPRLVAKQAGPGVIVVSGIPHWHAHPNAEDIEEFSKSYFFAVFQTILDNFDLNSLHIVAESQAAPAPIMLTIAFPDKVRNIALVRPLGFTVKTFGDTPNSRMKTFKKRIFRTYLQLPQSFLHDPKNLLVSLTAIRAMLSEPTITSLNKKYAAGISYDLLQECKQAAEIQHNKGNTLTIVLGEKDKMFPPEEITTSLKASNIKDVVIEIVPADTHSSLAVRASRQALHLALDKVGHNIATTRYM